MLRVGWWATSVSGSPYRVGEYENWTAGPFVNVDGLWTDGTRTLDLTATMTDDSSGSVHGYYFGPGLSGGSGAGFEAKLDYEGFPHNLGHDPLNNMLTASAATPNSSVVKQDLNAGQDYAIQVQEYKANFKGQLTDNVRWRLDVFGMEKSGVRQANAPTQCFVDHPPIPAGDHVCHDLSQAQVIDWTTTEVTPRLEANSGELTIEYSHPIRVFSANDSTVTRTYNGSSAAELPLSQPYPAATINWPYAVVDNNVTNIDQLKIGLDYDENKFYSLMLIGETSNETVGTNRYFNSADVRWTNNSVQNLTLTTRWKMLNESETLPNPALTPVEDYFNPAGAPSTNQDTGRRANDAGFSALWRPFGRGFGLGGLAIHGSYDYEILHRDDAIYTTPASPPAVPVPYVIDETYTRTNTFELRPTVRWSPTFDTYFKYRCVLVDQPLIGVKNINGTYNTLLPQQDNLAEIGGTWLPTKEIVVNATVGIEQAHTNIPDPGTPPGLPINFSENSYPYSISVAYTPTAKWTLTGGYANYTDFISQLITLGDDYVEPATTSLTPPFQTRWGYLGEAEVFDLGSTYRWSKDVKFTGAVQYTHGIDTITPLASNYPGPFPNIGAGTSYYNLSSLPGYSRVIIDTVRVQAGVDWQVRAHLTTFLRYQYYNFNDPTQPYNTGIANGFLVGFNWVH
jgi:hypothetical protein